MGRPPRKKGSLVLPRVPVWTTLVTWVLIKISKFDLESAGVRYETEALLLWPPPIENWVQPCKRLGDIRRMYVGQTEHTNSYWVPRVHVLVERKLGVQRRVENRRVERGCVLNTDLDGAIRTVELWIDLPPRVVTIRGRN